MIYLMMQMLLCLLIAFLLGLWVGWWLGRRKLEQRIEEVEGRWQGKLDRGREELTASQAEVARLSEASGACEEALAQTRADLAECQAKLEECRTRAEAPDASAAVPAALADLGGDDAEAEVAAGDDAVAEAAVVDAVADAVAEADAVGEAAAETAAEAAAEAAAGDEAAAEAAAGAAAAIAAFADLPAEDEPSPSDDLTRIEGIGPKIAELLGARGITTWAQLAETEVSFLQSVLDDAGPRYRVHVPETWPRQAALAAAGSWDELDALQDRLDGGREVVAAGPDDLKRVEGIGPKIEGLLNDRGVTTWAQLAKTEVSFLQSVLDDAGPRYRIHDPETWPQQAALAAAGSWDELDELQDRLKGGRET